MAQEIEYKFNFSWDLWRHHRWGSLLGSLTLRLRAAMLRDNPASAIRGALSPENPSPITILLVRWREGDRGAFEELMPLVYDELRRLASYYLRQERNAHTLQSTALVHEAYLRLAGEDPPQWQNRAHFYGIAAKVMRRILVEHARAEAASKRGGGALVLTLSEAVALPNQPDLNIMELDRALSDLAELDEQQSRIVELRFFGGLTIEDTSEVLGISPATVKRDWVTARAWLYRALTGKSPA